MARRCMLEPVGEIFDAARYLDAAVSAHLAGRRSLADELIRAADMPAIRDWAVALWGKGGPHSRPLVVAEALPPIAKADRTPARMPNAFERRAILERDGYRCRFCGIPVARREVRDLLSKAYPDALPWAGRRDAEKHGAFLAIWFHPDHVLPHARGGTNDISNLVVACAPCNCGRAHLTLAEVDVEDPRPRQPETAFYWDGLERFRP